MDIKRTWSIPTSPRNPYKLSDELILLAKFEGKKWDKKTQGLYAHKLGESEFYEGKIYAKEPEFSARDRVNRSPKTFGFVRFDDKKKVKITPAGKQLITKKNLSDLFLRQLLKWQYPSVKHGGGSYAGFRIRPFLEILRLAHELKGLTKREIAIFGITLINYKDYESTKKEILEFRKGLASLSNARDRKVFTIKTHMERYKKVYASEIRSGAIKLREQKGKTPSVEDFLKTKMRNSIDYADAAIRYFRATGLFTISARTFRLGILDTKTQIAEAILKSAPREPADFTKDPSTFLDFLGDPSAPPLPDDNIEVAQKEVSLLVDKIKAIGGVSPQPESTYAKVNLSKLALGKIRNLRDELEKALQKFLVESEIKELQSYKMYSDIIEIFDKIKDPKDIDIPDKPLFFEWNTWRALNMLDDGEIEGNLAVDNEGKPLHNAPGGFPDIVCYYKDFVLVVEVTLTSGVRQYEAEGEPVARHLGEVQKTLSEKRDKRPVFGLFIAVNINPATIAHFFVLRKTPVHYYGGTARIIPLDLAAFLTMIEKAKDVGGIKAEQIYNFISWADILATKFSNEADWYEAIIKEVPDWTGVKS